MPALGIAPKPHLAHFSSRDMGQTEKSEKHILSDLINSNMAHSDSQWSSAQDRVGGVK